MGMLYVPWFGLGTTLSAYEPDLEDRAQLKAARRASKAATMTPRDADIDAVRDILESFVDELAGHLTDRDRFEDLLTGHGTLTTADLGAEPESWTEDILINPILDHLDPARVPGRPSTGRQTPDFQLRVDEVLTLIGESKSINKVDEAETDLIGDYISRKSWSDYGVATDGFDWILYQAEAGGDFYQYNKVESISLRETAYLIAQVKGYLGGAVEEVEDEDAAIRSLLAIFETDQLATLLKREAPQRLREQRKEEVAEFFDLYIGLIFGKGQRDRYTTSLRDDIRVPASATQKEQDVFAVTLVNRLLFIKMLENRGVLDEGFLSRRIEDYDEALPISLYRAVVRPLFYDLLNTPPEERSPEQQRDWFAEVPYLNGGLFRPNVPSEDQYDVLDRSLRRVIEDLVEGYELDLDVDPKILGSVFEKTINYISEEENRQQAMGAYYTPDDVTRLIVRQSVDRRVKDLLLDSFAGAARNPEGFLEEHSSRPLRDLLRAIEDREDDFANRRGLEQSIADIKQLKILDPACGSGHFLTAALEELYQVLMSLLRGYSEGEPSAERAFEEKKLLALNCIYGVDIDPVAVEIAKLRVWLKIIEEGWEETHGRLPNIDFNIVAGNSLIGLPVSGEEQLQLADAAIDDLIRKRREYKYDDAGSRDEIRSEIAEISTSLDENYLNLNDALLTRPFESVEDLDDLFDRLGQVRVYPTFRSVQIRRADGEDLSEEDRERLGDLGCSVYTKSARLQVDEWVEQQRGGNGADGDELLGEFRATLTGLAANGYSIAELQRHLVADDLRELPGRVFHWPAHFPEALPQDAADCPRFDVVLGNPPYGDVLTHIEKAFLASFETAGVSDIAAPFVERSRQLMKEDGYYGNIITLRFVYQRTAEPVRDFFRDDFTDMRIACFARRPEQVFDGAQARSSIVTARAAQAGDNEPVVTSRFIRLTPETRDEQLSEISYASTEGLTLGDTIGDDEEDYSLPKVGNETIRSILLKLRDATDEVIGDWRLPNESPHRMWRRRGCGYWMNPMLENLYPAGGTPTSMYPIDLETELQRKWIFLVMQSSLYYLYWMVYKNERNIDWMEIDAFPVIPVDDLGDSAARIDDLANRLWDEMADRFEGEQREVFRDMADLKPLVDEVDEFIGPLYGLDDAEIEYVKGYDADQRASVG